MTQTTLGQNVPKPSGLFLMDGIKGLLAQPRHSVDMLLTDPPYGTTRNYWDVPLPLEALWEAVRWAVKPNGAVLLFAQCPFDKVLGASNLAMLRYEWVWYKERGTGFLNAMQASGLMDSAEGEYGSYELRLTVYDQGYSLVAPGLNQLSRVSRLTLLLSAAAAGLAVLVLAVIHVLRMRREIAAMRSLGTKKRQIMAIALSGVLLVCLIGAAVGACAGHVLSAKVTERVLASAEEDAADTTFTAMMGEETAKEFTFALESEPRLALAAGGAVVAVFAVFAALLLAAELQKPPMAQLGVKE